MPLQSAVPVPRRLSPVLSSCSVRGTVDVVLRRTVGGLVVTPGAEVSGDALYTFLVALAGCIRSKLVVDLTNVFPTEVALVAVRDAVAGAARQRCQISLVDERPVARRRINRLGEGLQAYASVGSAIGTS